MKAGENTKGGAMAPAVSAWQAEIAAERTPTAPVEVVASAAAVATVSADLPAPHRDVQAVPALPPVSTQAALAPSATLAQAARNRGGAAAASALTERTSRQVAPSVPPSVPAQPTEQAVTR